MKLKHVLPGIVLGMMLLSSAAYAQLPVLEKSYDISRKAKNGYLGGVEVNAGKETFDMVFVLRSSTKKMVKREIYTYDKELNLINTEKDEQPIEQMKKKYKWFNFKGDSYVSHSLSASANLTGKLVFRKKEITWKYLWLTGSYNKSVKQLEKAKATNEGSGEKYFFRGGAYEVKPDSTVLVMAGRQEKKNDLAGSMMHYDILSCDNQVNIKTVGTVEFKYPNIPVYSAALEDDNSELDNDDYPRDWVMVFAPNSSGGGVDKDVIDPDKNNYTYIRLNTQGEVLEKFNFKSPSNGWRVLGAYDHDGSVFVYGSANNKDQDKYVNQVYKTVMVPTTSADDDEKEAASSGSGGLGALKSGFSMLSGSADFGITQGKIDEIMDAMKYTNFQIGKISNGKFDFLSCPTIEDFEKLQAKPSDQKKFAEFDGKSFVINGISFSKSGDVFVNGQDFKKIKKGRSYKGVYMFQFDPTGNLKRNYGVFLDQSKTSGFFNKSPLTSDMIPSKSFIQESGDGKSLYWMMRMAKSIHKESHTTFGFSSNTETTTWSPLYNMEYGSINIADGQLSEFKFLGESEKKSFYLFPNTNETRLGNYSLFFSETEKGDKILLSRVDLTK
ncbi:hypothetical protein [Mucilaginibacter gilvus]|uniref:DUF3472 domain-containing protein n=1 Tax=Mucilaginibacter gilvus TaxID=2305909 RepID=A0A3S3X2R3_9SPHI|nr:hypothetical protein [Mucilaginibacter gilvus]RWY49246.1 hypothetical protein EPL05_17695 [Mucilaginibacter gilvus]